jgi:hypothetical protein
LGEGWFGLTLTAFGIIAGMLSERLLVAVRARWYFALAIPLGEDLTPVSSIPDGGGRTQTVRYEISKNGTDVLFWAEPKDRSAPMGLHGVVRLHRRGARVGLKIGWAPPWTPFAAFLWFALMGAARGQGPIAAAIAALLCVMLFVAYRSAALRAARELRWAFVQGPDIDP